MSGPGRPATGAKDGVTRLAFNTTNELGDVIRAAHRKATVESGISLGPWLERLVLRTLGHEPQKTTRSKRAVR